MVRTKYSVRHEHKRYQRIKRQREQARQLRQQAEQLVHEAEQQLENAREDLRALNGYHGGDEASRLNGHRNTFMADLIERCGENLDDEDDPKYEIQSDDEVLKQQTRLVCTPLRAPKLKRVRKGMPLQVTSSSSSSLPKTPTKQRMIRSSTPMQQSPIIISTPLQCSPVQVKVQVQQPQQQQQPSPLQSPLQSPPLSEAEEEYRSMQTIINVFFQFEPSRTRNGKVYQGKYYA